MPTVASWRNQINSDLSRNLVSSKMASHNSEAPVLDNYQAVVSAYSDFLIVSIHTILYERNIYPQTSFIKARKYNYPVRQSRHPRLCKWIMDAVASVEAEMLKVLTFLISVTILYDYFFERLSIHSFWILTRNIEIQWEVVHQIRIPYNAGSIL